jgi:hypothetical protein
MKQTAFSAWQVKAKDRLLWRILMAVMSMAYNNSFYEGTGND